MFNFDKLFNMLMEAHVGVRSSNPKRDLEIGLGAEEDFVQICEQHGFICEKSSKKEDMEDHFDYRVWKRNKDRAWIDRPENVRNKKQCNYVEVKDKKLLEGTNDQILVELTNVSGKDGWLYGKANYIAYRKLDGIGFRMIPRYFLMKEVEKLCNITRVKPDTFIYNDTKQPVKITTKKYDSTIKGDDGRCVLYNRDDGMGLVIYVPDSFIEQLKAFELLPLKQNG